MDIKQSQSRKPFPPEAKKVFEGVIFDMYQWEQKMFDGSVAIFEKLKRRDTVVILPVTTDGPIVMIDQQQPDTDVFSCLPGGVVDYGENELAAARRELLEETGYESPDFELWFQYQPYSKIDWTVFVYIARSCTKSGEQNLDNGEKITVRSVGFDEFIEWITSGQDLSPEMALRVLRMKSERKLDDLRRMLGL